MTKLKFTFLNGVESNMLMNLFEEAFYNKILF